MPVMGNPDTTAQVHPKKLTEAMLAKSKSAGVTLRTAIVTGIEFLQHESVELHRNILIEL